MPSFTAIRQVRRLPCLLERGSEERFLSKTLKNHTSRYLVITGPGCSRLVLGRKAQGSLDHPGLPVSYSDARRKVRSPGHPGSIKHGTDASRKIIPGEDSLDPGTGYTFGRKAQGITAVK